MTDHRVALSLVACAILAVLIAPELVHRSPDESLDPARNRNQPPGTQGVARESGESIDPHHRAARRRVHVLGTDHLGRDLLSRLAHGLRNSLVVALLATALAVAAGGLVGLASGIALARIDHLIMRGVDVLMAVPKLFLVLAVAAAAQPGPVVLVPLLAGITWMPVARAVRGEVSALMAEDFVLAARASGLGPSRILARHVLPHLAAPLLILASLQVGSLILLESALSFLGAGLPLPTASLGGMVAEAALQTTPTWWTLIFPGATLTFTCLACSWAAARAERALP